MWPHFWTVTTCVISQGTMTLFFICFYLFLFCIFFSFVYSFFFVFVVVLTINNHQKKKNIEFVNYLESWRVSMVCFCGNACFDITR